MNKIKKRLLSCLLCATGGLNLNAKALEPMHEQKKTETSVSKGSDRKYSREGSLFSLRTMAEFLLGGRLIYDEWQNHRLGFLLDGCDKDMTVMKEVLKNQEEVSKKLDARSKELDARSNELDARSNELDDERKTLANQKQKFQSDMSSVENARQRALLWDLCEMLMYSRKAQQLLDWEVLDSEKQNVERLKFGENTRCMGGYINFYEDEQKTLRFCLFDVDKDYYVEGKRNDFVKLIHAVDLTRMKNIQWFDCKYELKDLGEDGVGLSTCSPNEHFGLATGIYMKPQIVLYRNIKGSDYSNICYCYFDVERERVASMYCLLTVGKVVDRK